MLRRPIEHHSLKPFVFPPGFKLLQDTREQLPLFPENAIPVGLQIENRCLKDGDYSVAGLESMVFIERKGLGDLLTYIGKDRARTKEKLSRVDGFLFKALMIEVAEQDLLHSRFHYSNISPEVVRQTLAAFEVKYNLHIYYFRDRMEAQRWLLDRLVKIYKYIEKGDLP